MIRRLLRAFGLVSRGNVRVVEEKLRAMRQRLDRTSERLARAEAASHALQQTRRDEARRYKALIAALEAEPGRRTARADEAAARASRRIAALEAALQKRDTELEAAAREETRLEQRVAAALEELRTARDALAVVEVKLDILEGAANVLDSRTRPAGSAARDDAG